MLAFLARMALCASMVFALLAPARAAVVIGGSDLLTAPRAAPMQAWLTGDPQPAWSGPLTFTNIFDKAPGDTRIQCHAAVDGKGPTFFVMEATDQVGGDLHWRREDPRGGAGSKASPSARRRCSPSPKFRRPPPRRWRSGRRG